MGSVAKGVHVHNFCNTLRDLRTIIKAFRGTTPIIHMMSTGKCLQHQEKIAGRRSSSSIHASNRNRHADMQSSSMEEEGSRQHQDVVGVGVGVRVEAPLSFRGVLATTPSNAARPFICLSARSKTSAGVRGRGKRGRGRDDGNDFRKTAKYSNENLCLHYEFLYSVAFA